VPRVEDDRVPRGVEHPVERDRQLDDAEVRAEVTARAGHRRDEEVADLRRELHELLLAEPPQVRR
jgi:hypothetical protein